MRTTNLNPHKVLIAAALIIPALLFTFIVWQDYKTILGTAQADVTRTVNIFEQHALHVFETHQLVAERINDRLKGMSWDEIEHSTEISNYLKNIEKEYPQVHAIWLADSSGIVRNASMKLPDVPVSVTDRDYFQVLSRNTSDLFIGHIVKPRVMKSLNFNIAYRRGDRSNKFDGIIIVTASPEYFSDFWNTVTSKKDSAAILLRSDGAVLARSLGIDPNRLTFPADSEPLKVIKNADEGSYISESVHDGTQRIFGFHKIDKYNAYIFHGVSMKSVLQKWRGHSVIYGSFFSIALFILIMFALSAQKNAKIMHASQEALRESEERQRVLSETMLQGVVHQDAIGTIITMNPAAERILGKSREELRGKSSVNVEHDTIRENGDIFPGMEHPTMVALRTGLPVRSVVMGVFNPKLDEYRWIGIDAVPVFRPGENHPSEVYSIFGDITNRKQAEMALQASEQRIQQALHVSRSFTFDWLPMTDQVIRSASCGPILKLSGDGAVNDTGKHYFQNVHPEDSARFGQILRDLTPAANSYITEYRYVCKNGSEITLEETGQASFDATGRILRLVGVSTDITSRKQAEEALRAAHAELELRVAERTGELAKTIETLHEEIIERERTQRSLQHLNRLYAVLSETNHAIVRVSERNVMFSDFCRIAVEHGGFILCWIGLVDEQSGKVQVVASSGASAYLDNVRISANKEPEGEGPTGIVIREGTYYICNDFQNDPCTRPWHEQGKAHGIRASASIAIRENGRVIGALTLYGDEKDYFDVQHLELLLQMGMDVSFALDNLNRENRRQAAEKALFDETAKRLRAVEALREHEQMLIHQNRQAAMGEMIGNIAHQWRQPLNVLGLTIQQQLLLYDLGGFNREFLEKCVSKSMELIMHMSKTIDDFKNYFKPDKAMIEFNVRETIVNTLSLLEGSIQNPKITVEIAANDNPVINGYRNEFSQVLLNILTNASDALIEREINDPRVKITVCCEDGTAVVTVADNAGGIPEEIIGKIFNPYFTTKGLQQGTGIGLFMSKTIIEKNMGGRLTVRNIANGAEFRIEVENGSHC